jgi:quercetin dioxygenase-like cupin family protein
MSQNISSSERIRGEIISAEFLLNCVNFQEALTFFTNKIGFEIESIYPADSPSSAVLSNYGIRIHIECNGLHDSTTLILNCHQTIQDDIIIAPNGTRIKYVSVNLQLQLPNIIYSNNVVHVTGSDNDWTTGRAGMRYRDLIPSRLGGKYIASHIHIPIGGPVPDYTHYHKIFFQLIYCKSGWVEVMYQHQGPSFILHAGDCVLQPPCIRHQVLQASDNLEVIEVGCPAIHHTIADRSTTLPTPDINCCPTHTYSGLIVPYTNYNGEHVNGDQTFIHHICSNTTWEMTPNVNKPFWLYQSNTGSSNSNSNLQPPWEYHNTQFHIASKGVVTLLKIRPKTNECSALLNEYNEEIYNMQNCRYTHESELFFMYVLCGSVVVILDSRPNNGDTTADECKSNEVHHLTQDSSINICPHVLFDFFECSNDLEILLIIS